MKDTTTIALITALVVGGAIFLIFKIQERKRNEEIDSTIVTKEQAKDLIDNPLIN